MPWTGWVWFEARWWRAVVGNGLAQCSKKLTKHVDQHKLHDRDTCMTLGDAPAGPPLYQQAETFSRENVKRQKKAG